MRIMTRQTRDATVAFCPTPAFFQTIRLKPKVEDAERLGQSDVRECAMACAAKIHLVYGIELAGIQNRL
jgi:hypothetical protein